MKPVEEGHGAGPYGWKGCDRHLQCGCGGDGHIPIQNFDANGAGTLYPQVTAGFAQAGIYAATLKGEGNGTPVTGELVGSKTLDGVWFISFSHDLGRAKDFDAEPRIVKAVSRADPELGFLMICLDDGRRLLLAREQLGESAATAEQAEDIMVHPHGVCIWCPRLDETHLWISWSIGAEK